MKKLHYKIYRCYEIVILDEEENEVGECNYCYGTKADAIEMAKHELEIQNLFPASGLYENDHD